MNKHNIYDFDAIKNITASRIKLAFDSCNHDMPEISDISGFPQAQLKKIRDGYVDNLSTQALWRLALALSVNPYWLLAAPHNEKKDFVEDMGRKRIAFIGDIIEKVSEAFKVHRQDILGRAKYDFILPARFALCKILYERGMSYSQIGRVLDRDHTTIMHAVRRAEYIMERDKSYAAKINEIARMELTPVRIGEK